MVETAYYDLLRVLLEQEGFFTRHINIGIGGADVGVDLEAENNPSDGLPKVRLAAQFKYLTRDVTVSPSTIEQSLRGAATAFDRLLLVANRPFSAAAKAAAAAAKPVEVELVDLARLRHWLDGLHTIANDTERGVVELSTELVKRLALVIAERPGELRALFWRQVEELVGVLFAGLGFEVEVTPPSADGGKDVICTCTVEGTKRKYYIEVKHHQTDVAAGYVKSFVQVVANDRTDGGLYLSTGGFGPSAFQVVAEVGRPVALGDSNKLVGLCRLYRQHRSGLLQAVPDKWDFFKTGTQLLRDGASPTTKV